MNKVGSLLDLLPRPRSVEYNAQPKFIRDEIDLLRKGGRPVVSEDLRAVLEHVAAVPKRLDELAIEQRVLAAKVSDVHRAQSELGTRLLSLLAEIQKEMAEHRAQLSTHEKRLDSHDVQLGVHAKKHVEHAEAITGIHKKLVVLEETALTVTKRKPRKKARSR